MARYVLHERRITDNDTIMWVLAVDYGASIVDRFIVYHKPYNKKDLYIRHDQLYSKDLLKITRSFDGSNLYRVIEKGHCKVIQKKPLVLQFNGRLMNGTIVMPMNNKSYKLRSN